MRSAGHLGRTCLSALPVYAFFLFAITATARAQAPAAAKAVAPKGLWLVTTTDGKTTGGSFLKFGSDEIDWLPGDGGAPKKLTWPAVEEFRRNAPVATYPATDANLGPMILLPAGDRLRGEAVALLEKGLAIQSVSCGVLNLPAAQWSGVVMQPPKDPAAYLRLYSSLRKAPARPGDTVILANGDRIQGTIVELDGEILGLQPAGTAKPARLKRSEIIAVAIDPRTATYPSTNDLLWEINLGDGSRLSATAISVEEGEGETLLLLTTRWGATWKAPLSKIASFHQIIPKQIRLDETKPDAVQSVDYIGLTPAPRPGTNIEGGPLKLGDRYFEHGWGTQSRTLMAYRLKGGETAFTAWVGVDATAGPLGQARAQVLLDGKPVFDSGPMKAGEAPRRVQVPINSAKLLILSSDFGEGGGIRDWIDWCDPVLK